MKIFNISPLMEGIREAIERGESPDPAAVSLLVQEGPRSIEDWCFAVNETECDVDVIKSHIEEMDGRLKARRETVKRMKAVLLALVDDHFGGKVRTPLITVWSQAYKTYVVTADPSVAPHLFKMDPTIKQQEIINYWKTHGTPPEGATVVEKEERTLRIKI